MLRLQMSLFRRETSVFMYAFCNNLHTSQISGQNKLKRRSNCEPVTVAIVSIIQ